MSVTAETRATSPREAQRRNADAMKPVQDRLRATGIPDDAIKTTVYDLQQDWDYSNNRRTLRGYVARNTISVRIDTVDRVGELLDLVVSAGATGVDNIRFDVKDRDRLEREALRLAFAHHKSLARGLKGVQTIRSVGEALSQETTGQTLVDMIRLDMLVGSGGVLSHAPRRDQLRGRLAQGGRWQPRLRRFG